jgi:hypothetical protein
VGRSKAFPSAYSSKPKEYTCECGKRLPTSERYRHESGECPIHKPASPEAVKKLVEEAEKHFEEIDAQTPEEIHEFVSMALTKQNQ